MHASRARTSCARSESDAARSQAARDSGGGGAFASEVIRRECEKARAEGKPVHINATNIADVIPPAGGTDTVEPVRQDVAHG